MLTAIEFSHLVQENVVCCAISHYGQWQVLGSQQWFVSVSVGKWSALVTYSWNTFQFPLCCKCSHHYFILFPWLGFVGPVVNTTHGLKHFWIFFYWLLLVCLITVTKDLGLKKKNLGRLTSKQYGSVNSTVKFSSPLLKANGITGIALWGECIHMHTSGGRVCLH